VKNNALATGNDASAGVFKLGEWRDERENSCSCYAAVKITIIIIGGVGKRREVSISSQQPQQLISAASSHSS
jgi:hypothetical protein